MTSSLRGRLAPALSTTLVLALLLAGCGLGAGDPPSGVQLTVTRDAGADVVLDERRPTLAGEDTVLRLLKRHADVKTRYSGAFVESIDGHSGGEGGWLYWVDGVAADRGAASWRLRDGEHVWWDLRGDGSTAGEIPAVVGAFPAPLVGGFDGRAGSVAVDCAAPEHRACALVRERLGAAGVRFATAAESALDTADRRAPVRVVVGRFDELRTMGPEAASIDGGKLGSGAGLVAALRQPPRAPVWIVSGDTDQAVRRAAKTLDEPTLRHRVAIVVDRAGVRSLPEPPR